MSEGKRGQEADEQEDTLEGKRAVKCSRNGAEGSIPRRKVPTFVMTQAAYKGARRWREQLLPLPPLIPMNLDSNPGAEAGGSDKERLNVCACLSSSACANYCFKEHPFGFFRLYLIV